MKKAQSVLRKTKDGQNKQSFKSYFRNNWQLYVMILPAVVYFIIFHYLPMYGIQIAFKDYKAVLGINASPWVGFKHFTTFFNAYYFKRLLANTLLLNVENLIISFPIPIIMAIMLNQIKKDKVKRGIQTSIYVPYFISTVVLAGMLYIFLSPTSGIFNTVRGWFGLKEIDYMSSASAFRPIYILSSIWQNAGYSTILFIAALAGVDQALYEAAEIDGAENPLHRLPQLAAHDHDGSGSGLRQAVKQQHGKGAGYADGGKYPHFGYHRRLRLQRRSGQRTVLLHCGHRAFYQYHQLHPDYHRQPDFQKDDGSGAVLDG